MENMEKKAIVHIMSKKRMNSGAFTADLDAMEELSEKYKIKNIIFYKWEKIDYLNIISKLEKFWIFTQNYSNKQDLVEKLKKFNQKYEIVFVYTAMELMIKTANLARKSLGLVISEIPNIFRDKSVQRKALLENWEWLWIKYIKWEPNSLNIEKIEKEIDYPFILKPVNWVQSSWVIKVEKRADFLKYISNFTKFHDKLKARWIETKELIIEEFIDWNLYTLDYFVSEKWLVIFSKPAQEILWIDLWVKDYCVVARVASTKVENDLDSVDLKKFIEETVKACKLRNTFVHHEFKLTSKWLLKTIELNWRFWGWRVDLFKEAYEMNLFEMLLNPNIEPGELKKNNIVFNICATKRWKLLWIDEKLFDLIRKRETVESLNFEKKFIWKEVWLTKDWFTKMWTIKLVSSDLEKIMKDFEYVKSRYKKLLLIEQKNKKENKWFFTKIKDLIVN